MPRRVCDYYVNQDEKDNLSTLISFHLNHEESEMTQSEQKKTCCLSNDDGNDDKG